MTPPRASRTATAVITCRSLCGIDLLQLAVAPPAASIDRTPVHRVHLQNVHSMDWCAIYGPVTAPTPAAPYAGCLPHLKSAPLPDATRHVRPHRRSPRPLREPSEERTVGRSSPRSMVSAGPLGGRSGPLRLDSRMPVGRRSWQADVVSSAMAAVQFRREGRHNIEKTGRRNVSRSLRWWADASCGLGTH